MTTYCYIRLFFPLDRIADALDELIRNVDGRYESRPLDIGLPNERTVRIYISEYEPPHFDRLKNGNRAISFDTSFIFSVDAVIQEYIDTLHSTLPLSEFMQFYVHFIVIDGFRFCPIADLSIGIVMGRHYTQLSIGTVSALQNPLLRSSESIHRVMINVLKAADGVAGLIDQETGDFILLTDPSRTLHLDLADFNDGDDVDGIAKAAMSQPPT